MKKFRKRAGRIMAAILAVMLIMQIPVDYISFADGNNGSREEESTDWSDVTQAVTFGLDKVSWQESGEIVELAKEGERMDLSGVPLDAAMTWSIRMEFTGLDIYTINPSDQISFEIPGEYWNVPDTDQPLPLHLWGKTLESPDSEAQVTVGYAEAADHKVTVTFDEGIRELSGTKAHGALELPVLWNTEHMTENPMPAELKLQKGSSLELLLPAASNPKNAPAEGSGNAASQEDALGVSPVEGQESGNQAENAPDNSVQAETTPQGEAGKTDKECVPEPLETSDAAKEQGQNENLEAANDQEKGQEKEGDGDEKDPQEPAGFLGTIRRLFQKAASFFGIGGTDRTGAADAYFDGGTKTKHVFADTDVPEGFSMVKLTAVSRKEGYEENQTDAYVRFAFEVYMDEDFLFLKSDEFMQKPGFPQQGDLSDDAYYDLVEQWLALQPAEEVPDLSYTYELGDKFEGFMTDQTDLYSKADPSLKIGSYQINNKKLTVEMNKRLYFMNNITLQFSFDALLDGAKIPPDKQEAVLDDAGKLVFQALGTSSGGTGGTTAPKYKVEKDAPVQVTDKSITYEITVTALDGKNLNGMTLKDAMPEAGGYKLKVKSFTEKGSSAPLENAVDGSGNISYTFEALNTAGDNAITSAAFLLELELDDASYQKLINNGSMSQRFSNKAALEEAGASKPAAVSGDVKTQMKLTFIGKKGKASNLAGNRYNWTIELNTSLPYLKDGFLVDTLCWTDHSYDVEKGITITAVSPDGSSATVTKQPELITGTTEWNYLTADALRTLADGRTEPFYYRMDTTDPNPFYEAGRGSSEFQQNAVLVIPYNGYANKKVTVTYDTVLNMNGLNSNEYVERTAAYQPKVENKVNLLWDNQYGTGPGPGPVAQDQVSFGKTVTTDLNAVSKRGISYDQKTRRVKWGMDVNRLGVDLTEVMLTDGLGTSRYDLSQFAITYFKYDSRTNSQAATGTLPLLAGTPNRADAFGYTLDPVAGELKIYLGDLTTKADGSYFYYSLTCETVLKDVSILSNQSNQGTIQTIRNHISLDAKYKGNPYQKESEADLQTPNTLIEKEAVGTYNYMTHELIWKVTVNPNKLEIQNAKVTDTLETGFTYGELQKVEINGSPDEAALQRIKESAVNNTSSTPNTIAWTLGTIQPEDTYTLYFTAAAGNAWRQANLVSGPDMNAAVVPNQVELTGIVGGMAITNATASASHAVEKQPVEKKGVMQYQDGEPTGEIVWTVWVNRGQYNISGYYLEEELKDEADGEKIHELDPDSVKLEWYKGPIGTGGSDVYADVTDHAAVTALKNPDGSDKSMADGFRYTFPADLAGNYSTYRLTFSTWLTQAAEAGGASIANKVYLKSGDDSYTEESNTDDGGFHGGFNFDRAAAASPRPKIGLWKISKNSINTGTPGASDSLGLDAVFSLEGYELKAGNISGNGITLTTPVKKYNKERKVKAGDATFLNINPNDNMIYVLREKSSHTGYQKESSDPYFLYFVKDTDLLDGKADEDITIHFDSKDYTAKFMKAKKGPDGKYNEGNLKKVIFTNVPNTNSFTFTKKELDKAGYNPKGGIPDTYGNAAGVVFKAEPQGALRGKINTFYTEPSAADGSVKLQNLDPGTYKLTEVKSNPGYANGGTVLLKVTAAEDGITYQFEFSSPTGGIKKEGAAVLQDDLLRTAVSFTKYAGYQDAPVKKEPLGSIAFHLEGVTQGYTGAGNNFSQDAASNAQGAVKFTGIPVGTYQIYELPAAGYKTGTEAAQVKVYDLIVTEKETTAVIGAQTINGITTEYKKKQASAELRPVAGSSFAGDKKGISNIPIKGTITLQKNAKDSTLTGMDGGLEGAEFALCRKIKGVVDSAAAYTARSDSNGAVTFTDVEYGDYQLKEITAPAGYVKTADPVDIPRSNLEGTIAADKRSFAYTLAAPVDNTIYKRNVSFQKADMDGNPLSGIQFEVYRRNRAAIGADGAGMEVNAAESVASYWAYLPCASITSGADGTFALTELPYGDYLLKETNGSNLQQGYSHMAVWVSLRAESLTVKENSNFTGSLANVTTAGTDWKEINPDSGVYPIVNYKQFGFVNLNKCAAEKGSDGALQPVVKKLADVEFEIKKSDSPEVYLTLKTGADGRFSAVADGEDKGAYQDALTGDYKHLFPGTYTIQEKAAPEGFERNTEAVSFEIAAGTTGHEGTAWIALDGTGSAENPFRGRVSYQKAGEVEPADFYAGNEIKRGTVKLTKTNGDAEPVLLHGAEFLVYAGTDTAVSPVASLLEDGNTGTYFLSNVNPMDSTGSALEAVNATGLPYLCQDGTNFRLLTGVYTIKEVTAPEGYEISADTKQIAAEKDVEASITWKDQPILLRVQKTDKTGTTPLAGAEFSVTGIFAGQTAEETRRLETDPADGSISLLTGQLIADYTYVLRETKAPEGYICPEAEVEFQVDAKGTLTITRDEDAYAQVDAANKTSMLFLDEAVLITLKKTDQEDAAKVIGGVTYELYDMTGGEPGTKVTEATTSREPGTEGTVLLEGLIGGHAYQLRELSAPDIYQVSASPVSFKVQENGSLAEVTGGRAENQTTLTVTDRKLTLGLHKQNAEGTVTLTGGSYEAAPAPGSAFAGESQEPIAVTETDMARKLAGKLKAQNSYVLTEKTAPQGYELAEPVTFKVSALGEVEITEGQAEVENAVGQGYSSLLLKDEPIELAIRKTDPEGILLRGAEFAITPEPGSAFAKLFPEEILPEKLVVAGQDGETVKARLIAGNTYAVSETKEPEGYIRLAQCMKFTVRQDGTISLTENPQQAAKLDETGTVLSISNQKTKIYLDKISNERKEDGTIQRVAGAELRIEKNDGAPVTGMEWVSDGSNPGELTGLPAGRYRLREVKTPYGYCTAKPVEFELRCDNRILLAGEENPLPADENGVSAITMTDEVVRARAALYKRVEGESAGALAGVSFECYSQTGENPEPSTDVRLAEGLVTGADGMVRVEQLGQGSYYFMETKSPDQTWLDEEHKIWPFTVNPSEHGRTIEITAENKPFQASASVVKKDAETQEPIAGTEFTLSRQEGDAWKALSAKISDDRGEVSFPLRSKGSYRITETKAAPGYQLDAEAPWTQSFTADDASYQECFQWEAENERIGGTLALRKTDGATQNPLDGVVFTVYQKQTDGGSQGDENWLEVGSFATGQCYSRNADGSFQETPADPGMLRLENLAWGTYYIQETQAQEGYVPSQQKFRFTIDQRNLNIQLQGEQGGDITNAQTRIWFYKYGKYAEDCADADWGAIPDGSSRNPLAGSEFTVYRDKACTDEIARGESQENGLVEFYKLPCGVNYYIKETRASAGYLLNEGIYQAELAQDGSYLGITLEGNPIPDMSIVNDVRRVDISLKKVSEQDPDFILPGSTYGLFKRSSAIPKIPAGTMRARAVQVQEAEEEWTLIAKSVTNHEGRILFKGVLMDTDYMVRELEAPDGSQVSEQPVTIRFGVNSQGKVVVEEYQDGSGTAQVDPETGEIVWLEPPIMIGFSKKDTAGRLIAGAKLAVQDMEGNVLVRFTSSDTEPYVIYGDKLEGKLLAGHTYQLVEEAAPSGYLKAEPVLFTPEAKLTGPNETFIQQVGMTDAYTAFNVEKRAGDTQNYLPGAALTICHAADGRTARTCREETLSWETGDRAETIQGLAAGDYILRETKAPEGYELAEDIPFTLNEEGKVLIGGEEAAEGRIVMADARTKVLKDPQTPNPQDGKQAGGAKTGDENQISGYLLVMLFAAALAAEASRKRALCKARN